MIDSMKELLIYGSHDATEDLFCAYLLFRVGLTYMMYALTVCAPRLQFQMAHRNFLLRSQ